MSNVHYLPSARRITTGSAQSGSAMHARATAPAAMPSWVVENATLNRVISDLQRKGWNIKVHPHGYIYCRHAGMSRADNLPMDLGEAQQAQRAWDNFHTAPVPPAPSPVSKIAKQEEQVRNRVIPLITPRGLALAALLLCGMVGFIQLFARGIVIESDWRAERLCRIYHICN